MFVQEFKVDESSQACIFGFVDDTHPSTTELFKDAKMRDGMAD